MYLLNIGHNPKTIKSDKKGEYLTGILYLAPYKLSGYNVCSHATNGCIASCLNTAGRGRTNVVQQGRLRKTKLFFEQRDLFLNLLDKDISSLVIKSNKLGVLPAVRLNGTSDLPWEIIAPNIFTKYSQVQFYCYTKVYSRMLKFLRGEFPKNYHLTFSRSENNWDKCLDVLRLGGSVAVVFNKIPRRYKNYRVKDGDSDDLRFKQKGVIGLVSKGRAKHDKARFVV